jgi:hypothetical protein
VSFRWKDYRIEGSGRWKTMTLTPHEFIRRFLMHVLPSGFHRIRHTILISLAFLSYFSFNPRIDPQAAAPARSSARRRGVAVK